MGTRRMPAVSSPGGEQVPCDDAVQYEDDDNDSPGNGNGHSCHGVGAGTRAGDDAEADGA